MEFESERPWTQAAATVRTCVTSQAQVNNILNGTRAGEAPRSLREGGVLRLRRPRLRVKDLAHAHPENGIINE